MYEGTKYPPLVRVLTDKDTLESSCGCSKDLKFYLEQRAKWHNVYRHYYKLDLLKSLIDNKRLILSNGADWNDSIDRERFNDKRSDYVNFGMCFSFSQSESVAMWLLYAGRDASGGALCLSKYDMHKTRTTSVPYLVRKKANGQFDEIKRLATGEYEPIELIDVIYRRNGKATGKELVSHLGEKSISVDKGILDCLEPFSKNEAWGYENECRLIVKVKKDSIPEEYRSDNHEENSANNGRCFVALELNEDTLKRFESKVLLAPNCKDEQLSCFKTSELKNQIDIKWVEK